MYSSQCTHLTLFESENEWQKTEQVPIPLPRASRIGQAIGPLWGLCAPISIIVQL